MLDKILSGFIKKKDPQISDEEVLSEKQEIRESTESLDDQIRASLKAGKSGVNQRVTRKKRTRFALIIIGCIATYYLFTWLFAYQKASMSFGICKVFAELYVEYPTEFEVSYLQRIGKTMRIWFVHHDSFGNRQFDTMDCEYKRTDDGRTILDEVSINRRPLDPKIVEKFNNSLPALFAFPPDLTYPRGLPKDLKDYTP